MLGANDLGILRARFGRRQLEAHLRPVNLGQDLGPPSLDQELRVRTEKLDRGTSGTASAVGAEGPLTAIGISVPEPHPIKIHGLEGETAICTDSAPPVAESPHEFGLAFEATGPCPDAKNEIVAGAFKFVKL
jgi:hypothetical protein